MNLLLVDDNAKYKDLLTDLFSPKGYKITWVKNATEARENLRSKGINFYKTIITDITMETQVSGLILAIKLRKKGFRGNIIIASTGFNFRIVLWFSKFVLRFFGINQLIPKNSLKQNKPVIIDCI